MNIKNIGKKRSMAVQLFLIIVCFALFIRYGVKYDTGLGYREVILTLTGTTLFLLLFLKNSTRHIVNDLFVVFGTLIITSFLLSGITSYGIAEIFAIFAVLNTIFLVSQLGNKKLHILFWGLLILAFIASVHGLYNFTHQPDPRIIGNLINPLDHIQGFPNAFALFLLIMWPYAAHKMITSKSKFSIIISIIILGSTIGAFYLTYSRGALIALLIQLVIVALLNYKNFTQHKLKWIAGVFIAVLLITATLNVRAFNQQEISDIRERIMFENSERITSISERIHFFKLSANLIAEKPLFGHGPQSFRFVYPKEQELIYANSDHPHNIFLKYAVENGVVCSILLFLIFTIIIVKSIQKRTSRNKQSEFALVSFMGALAHNMIDYNFNFLLIYLVFGITIGILLKNTHDQKTNRRRKYRNPLFAVFVILSFILSIIGISDYFKTDPYSDFETIKRYTGDEVNIHIEKYSNSLYPREFWIQLSDYFFMRSEFDSALEMIEKHISHNPYDKYGFLNKGRILHELENFHEAKEALQQAIKLDSKNSLSVHYHFLRTLAKTDQKPSAEYLQNTLYPFLDDFVYYAKNNLHHVAQKPEVEYAECLITLLQALNDNYKDWDSIKEDLKDYAQKYRQSPFENKICK